MHYYTYAYLREDNTPYYIGKGTGNRIYSTNRIIKPPKDKSRIIFLKKNLTEAEAFKHEIYMIDVFGRKDLGTGILYNMTNGGEGLSGWVPSEETRKRIGAANKISLKGKKVTEEVKQKQSNTWKEKLKNNPRPMSYYTKNIKKMAERNRTDKEKHKRHGEIMKGRPSANRKPVLYDGNVYASMTETMEKTGLSRYLILNKGGKFINKNGIK
jgi:hypothetical protein